MPLTSTETAIYFTSKNNPYVDQQRLHITEREIDRSKCKSVVHREKRITHYESISCDGRNPYCSLEWRESIDVTGIDKAPAGIAVDDRQLLVRNTAFCCIGIICDPGGTAGRGCCCCCCGGGCCGWLPGLTSRHVAGDCPSPDSCWMVNACGRTLAVEQK